MKKLKMRNKIYLSIVLATTAITAHSAMAYGAPLTNRLGGSTRYETAVEICKSGWVDKSDIVILANGENFPDALSAAPLAKKYNAPILLVEREGMRRSVVNEIIRLKPKKIYIIGGTGVISAEIEEDIKGASIGVERLGGATRYETAIEIAKNIGVPSGEIAVTNGYEFAEATSISSIAAKKQMPLLLVNKEEMPQAVIDFLKDKKVEKSYILGGTDLISDKVANGFTNINRIGGKDRYERNINIIKSFEKDIDFGNIGIATGKAFPDALTGAALEGNTASPIFLVEDGNLKESTLTYVKSKLPSVKNMDVFGLQGAVEDETVEKISENKIVEMLPQFTTPKKGEEIGIFTTNKGIIKVRFFPQYAPFAVENFKTHGKEGYYNGLTFHRVIKDFMIQGGDPKGNGTGGESIWKEDFVDEFSTKLHNFRGALSMANSGPNTNGSQFFIVQNNKTSDKMLQQFQDKDEDLYSEGAMGKYREVGGVPSLDYHYTVFGQVIEGLDIVDKIATVSTDSKDKPIGDVIIQKIEFVKYE